LAPFRRAQLARPTGDPAPLAYLWSEPDQREGALDIELEVLLSTAQSRALGLPPHRIALSNSCHMYWTSAQLLAHHTSNGCNLRPGDLLGTGTLSGPTGDAYGSLLEATQGGTKPLLLPSGEQRCYLEEGDEVILQAHCRRQGFASIGFGECRAIVLAD
jgi:fumarylacetoacetase